MRQSPEYRPGRVELVLLVAVGRAAWDHAAVMLPGYTGAQHRAVDDLNTDAFRTSPRAARSTAGTIVLGRLCSFRS